jgi:hypothetical protein
MIWATRVGGRLRDIHLTCSQYHCTRCRHSFNLDMSGLAAPKTRSTHRVFVPFATTQNWVEAGGKKAADRIGADYLNWALDGFSGYIAADELYDGPFCVLSIVDNRAFKRLCYEVLDHPPSYDDVRACFQRFQDALAGRGLKLSGVTTDGSDRYPRPISTADRVRTQATIRGRIALDRFREI